MPKINIVMTKCKRCGKPLVKTDRSLYGLDTLKEKYGDICQDCMSEDETMEMLREQGQGIAANLSINRK